MRGLSPGGAFDWSYAGLPAAHVTVRVGQGETLPLSGGSSCLVNGQPLGTGGVTVRVSAGLSTEQAALHRSGSDYQESAYGARIPLHELQRTDDIDVIRLPLNLSTPPAPRFTYALPGVSAFTARITGRDVLSLIGATGTAQLVMAVQLMDGSEQVYLQDVRVDGTPPTGSVSASFAGEYTYLTYRDLSEDAEVLHLHFADFPTLSVVRPLGERGRSGVIGAATPALPVRVTATDDAGNESADLLVRARSFALNSDGDALTSLAPWPLPPYLNAKEPVLGAVLAAFTKALSIGADQAGELLDLRFAEGRALDSLSLYYGVTRRPGETDASLSARTRARFEAHKSTRGGLVRQLSEVDAGTVSVTDGRSQYDQTRPLDGTWKLDASVLLGGAALATALDPGEIMVTFPRVPLRGWAAAQHIVRTRKAAGVVQTLRLQIATHAVLGHAARTNIKTCYAATPAAPLARLTALKYSSVLQLDGTWTLNGAEQIDGTLGGTSVTTL